jgi:hypothetical protein
MADSSADYIRGQMIVQEHERTYRGFMRVTKWASLYVGSLVLFLTLWFCTQTGFLGAAAVLVVALVAGTLALSDKHKL